MNFRQGDTTTVLVKFSESIDGFDMKVGIYDENDTQVFVAKLSDTPATIESVGDNEYRITIPHTKTKQWIGKYYLDVLLKSPDDTSYVNVGETPVKLNFKAAKITEDL